MVKETKRKQHPASSNMSGVIFDKDGAAIASKEWRRAKAMFSYSPKHDDELQLEVGDIIEVMEEVEEGWWKGVLKGVVGVFPSNFVTELKDSVSPKEIKKSSVDSGFNTPTNQDVVPTGQKAGDTTDGSAESHAKKKIQIPKKAPPPPPPPPVWSNDAPTVPPRPVRELAIVMHPYTPENDDELPLKAGDIITIITKDVVDVGWWKGEINGQVGVFPDNFVQLLPVQEYPAKKPPRAQTPKEESSSSKFYNVPSSEPSAAPSSKVPSTKTGEAPTKKVPSEDKAESRPPLPPHKKPSPAKKPERLSFPSAQNVAIINPTSYHFSAASVLVNLPSQEESSSLDVVTSSCEQLPHLSRTKGPSRRPPTSLRNSSEPNGVLDGAELASPVSPAMPTIPPPPVPHAGVRVLPDLMTAAAHKPKTLLAAPEEKAMSEDLPDSTQTSEASSTTLASTQEIPSLPKKKSKSPLIQKRLPPTVVTSEPTSLATASTSIASSEASKEDVVVLQDPATSSAHECQVSRKQFLELQQQVEALRMELANQKTGFKKQILDLMAEVDEEKKIRLDLQVQLDRIKKLMTTV